MREILSVREGNRALQQANSTVLLPLRKGSKAPQHAGNTPTQKGCRALQHAGNTLTQERE